MALEEIPNDLVAEQSVLGSMFLSTYALQKACDALTAESFHYPKNAKIFSTVKDMFNKKIPIDATTITTELKNKEILSEVGGVEYLTEIFNIVPTAANIEHYIKIVENDAMLRRLIQVSDDIKKSAFEKQNDINATLDDAERKILSVVNNRRSTEFRTITEVLNSTKANLKKLSTQKGEVTGLSTGWERLDKMTAGLHEGQLIIIAARPAVGKSAWALNLATNAAINSDKTVAIFNMEMSAESLASRMLACVGHIEGYKLATGNLDDDWDKLDEAISKLSKTNIYMDDTPGITIGEIRSKCRRLANSEAGLDLVVIDYLQLITSAANYGGNRQQEVSDISRALKLMALELKVPVVALAQLSRSAEQRKENPRPILSDLRESGSIEQDADIVAFLFREDYYKKDLEKKDQASDLEFIVAKHRNGATGTIPLRFQKDISKFFSIIDNNKGEANE
ncbi:MAG: replicative DNA helicase [Bacilli bacterium]|nr:replicative DNA helicase [Bacilli bacterium]